MVHGQELISIDNSCITFFKHYKNDGNVKRKLSGNSLANLSKRLDDGSLSDKSSKLLKKSINRMYCLSEGRKVVTSTGKVLKNFRLCMVTLTLPSIQVHSDVEIKRIVLNQFLTELRTTLKINNYVWKAELQGNSNIHFHLIIDVPVNYYHIRRVWNRCVNKLGYVDAYRARMSSLSCSEYINLRLNGVINDSYINVDESNDKVKQYVKAYKAGCADNWSSPNSVSLDNISNVNDVANYLSKYLSKKAKKSSGDSESLSDRIRAFGKMFGRSQSLSKLKSIIVEAPYTSIVRLREYLYKQTDLVWQSHYYTSFYLHKLKSNSLIKRFIKELIYAYSYQMDYCPPVPIRNNYRGLGLFKNFSLI